MLDDLKKCIGKFYVTLGTHAVGKCMVPGMFDPKIPSALREESTEVCKNTLFQNVHD